MLKILEGDQVVFAAYDNGNVLMNTNRDVLERSKEAAQQAIDYLTYWIERSCMSSTESAQTQRSQET